MHYYTCTVANIITTHALLPISVPVYQFHYTYTKPLFLHIYNYSQMHIHYYTRISKNSDTTHHN